MYVFYPHPGVPATITYTSGYAENKTIELPDGSVVTLNAQSSLRLPEGGWKKDREVWLAGEAFFRISKSANGKRKFLVHTAEATIEVLGTQFNVDARRQKTDVVLAAGSIRLSTRDSVLILAPGDRAVYDGQRNELILEKVSPEDHTAWREGMIVFKNKTLEEVATKLQDIYGKKIVIRDEQKRSMRLFLSVDTNDLDEFLNILQTLEGDQLTISKEGETIILE